MVPVRTQPCCLTCPQAQRRRSAAGSGQSCQSFARRPWARRPSCRGPAGVWVKPGRLLPRSHAAPQPLVKARNWQSLQALLCTLHTLLPRFPCPREVHSIHARMTTVPGGGRLPAATEEVHAPHVEADLAVGLRAPRLGVGDAEAPPRALCMGVGKAGFRQRWPAGQAGCRGTHRAGAPSPHTTIPTFAAPAMLICRPRTLSGTMEHPAGHTAHQRAPAA